MEKERKEDREVRRGVKFRGDLWEKGGGMKRARDEKRVERSIGADFS